jgi:homoserine dehydrogenase
MDHTVHNIALLGFGNVLRAFATLLNSKNEYLGNAEGMKLRVVGIATNSKGACINADGIDLDAALDMVRKGESLAALHVGEPLEDTFDFIRRVPAEAVLEGTWLDPETGQPATDYCRTVLENGKHLITANKGPVAFAYRELSQLAAKHNLGFFYESTVMDGIPVHSVRREALLGLEVTRIRGILNSTTNSILTRLEEGVAFDDALREMQDAGLAEADPTNDIEGWDAAIKINVLANLFMGADLRPADIDRTGITGVTIHTAQDAVKNGERIKLVCEATRTDGGVEASVRPTHVPLTDPLANVNSTAASVSIDTDVLPNVTIIGGPSSPTTTAYGMLVDTLNALRGRR